MTKLSESILSSFANRNLVCRNAFEGECETGLLVGGGVLLNDAAFHCLINCFVCRREELHRSCDIFRSERLRKRFGRIGESVAAAQVEDALPRRGAYHLLCRTGNCHIGA